jgi:hypothetical protein
MNTHTPSIPSSPSLPALPAHSFEGDALKISEELATHGLRIEKVLGDGNCGPAALLEALQRADWKDLTLDISSVQAVRDAVAEHARSDSCGRFFAGDAVRDVDDWAADALMDRHHVDDKFLQVFGDLMKIDVVKTWVVGGNVQRLRYEFKHAAADGSDSELSQPLTQQLSPPEQKEVEVTFTCRRRSNMELASAGQGAEPYVGHFDVAVVDESTLPVGPHGPSLVSKSVHSNVGDDNSNNDAKEDEDDQDDDSDQEEAPATKRKRHANDDKGSDLSDEAQRRPARRSKRRKGSDGVAVGGLGVVEDSVDVASVSHELSKSTLPIQGLAPVQPWKANAMPRSRSAGWGFGLEREGIEGVEGVEGVEGSDLEGRVEGDDVTVEDFMAVVEELEEMDRDNSWGSDSGSESGAGSDATNSVAL